ncbi:Glycosyl transferase family 2 [Humidesulfovibrio mexicanus]|uniref:Glycosyl transferase family 2 n=1 Tax=Humidesulfovibrio mexicanus TaxID=147047 RepID=A0A238Y6W1_9BACT|nr:glycosyltransferase [Humidesulfovibrio mexicanus]SNR66692.1 Glycosyl transferase family 2 [Humidesulfovibrio mexicanus]
MRSSLVAATVCIGLPAYNGAAHLRQALDALLGQTYRDFRVVVLDDGSSDGTYNQLLAYAAADPRILLHRNSKRAGLIQAWNTVAELAADPEPPRYFAWYSDHDWVAKDWLEQLVAALESDPGTVLAHAGTVHIGRDGRRIETPPPCLDTSASSPARALRQVTLETFGAGDAVYGLFRYQALREAGFLPQEIQPDTLLVSRVAQAGIVRHVGGARRFRRVFKMSGGHEKVVARQLRTLFADEAEPLSAPHISHAMFFFRALGVGSLPVGEEDAAGRVAHAVLYLKRMVAKYSEEIRRELEAMGQASAEEFCSGRALALVEAFLEDLTVLRLCQVKLEKLYERCASLHRKHERIREKYERLHEDYDNLHVQHDNVREKYENLRVKHNSLRAKHENLRVKHEKLRTKHDLLREKHESLRANHD